jgi:hypothetical protein
MYCWFFEYVDFNTPNIHYNISKDVFIKEKKH